MKSIIFIIAISSLLSVTAYGFPYRGVCLTGWTKDSYLRAGPEIERLAQNNVNYISLNVFAFQDTIHSTEVYKDPKKTPSDESIEYVINLAKQYNMKVLLRINVDPQDGKWRALFKPKSLKKWFKSYTKTLVHYAKIAERHKNIDIFSIGTELKSLAVPKKNRKHWKRLAKAVRKVFSGKLTYGANWDIYKKTRLWKYVDIIGIDAYFPLSLKDKPTVEDLKKGWYKFDYFSQSHKAISDINKFRKKLKKDVIFAELGFPSKPGAAKTPWEWESGFKVPNLKIQAMCYDATIQVWRDEWNKGAKWFKGLFWWNWGINLNEGGPTCGRHTPKNKDAELVMKKRYGEMKLQSDIRN